MHILRQTSADLLQVFDNTRTRPVKVGAVLKHHIDVGVAEHGLCAHGLHMRRGEKTGHDRIGHLIFDDIGRLSFPGCVDDHLHIGDIRQCVQRHMLQRPDARKCEQQDRR